MEQVSASRLDQRQILKKHNKYYRPPQLKERKRQLSQKYKVSKCCRCHEFPSVKLTYKLDGINLVEYYCQDHLLRQLPKIILIRKTYKGSLVTVSLTDSDSEYTRKMIQGFIKIQEDILEIPGLSVKQLDDIKKLRRGLNNLNLQTNDAKVKLQLVDFMNSMNQQKFVSFKYQIPPPQNPTNSTGPFLFHN